jgi:hypothetical protein
MPNSDFQTIGTIIGVVSGAVGIRVFKDLFARPETPTAALRQALDEPGEPGAAWVKSRRKELAKTLVSPLRLGLSLFYLVVILGFVYLVLVGPDKVFPNRSWDALAERLKLGEQILYLLLTLPVAALYVWRVALPAWSGWKMLYRASVWLRKERRK